MESLHIDGKEIPLLLEPPEDQKKTPRRILSSLFKHRLLIAKVFLCVGLPLFILVLSMPKKYIATSRVLIKPGRAILLSPGSDGSSLALTPSPETINTEIQIIKSQELFDRLAKDVPLPNGKATGGLGASLTVTPVRATNVIQISFTGTDQDRAAKLANRAAELYIEQSLKVHRTQGIEEFYDEQEKKLQEQLITAETSLKEFQEREKIVDASIEISSDLQALAAFEKGLKETESAIRETEERIAVLNDQMKQQQVTISTQKNVTVNPVYAQMMDRITKLELERDNLLQRYTSKDRLVTDKEKEIEELKKRLTTVEATKVGSENISLNEVHRRILNELLSSKVQLQSMKERRNTLTKQVSDYSTTAADKKKKSFEYERLQQNMIANKEALALYKRKGEEARISTAMDERKFGNASVLEKATLPLPRAGFSPWLLLPAIMAFSLVIALGVALVIEFFNTTLQDEVDVEERTGLPVLATIEYFGS